ncbi:NAD(P)/FAD-dependent oxidoreductase [Metabacillus halosaccharovorans]|uniref:NAD(P)/FAD-dependent oxidoreductase n=1 Tax=Metabacillus halosaccharovorans TaxID=930124 RepID=UPI00203F6E00|nr:FAD-dependent oxidoreductase [Metabacillus halosaccharovorans]MCM3439888.1 FAD-binding oxidoreductase [Metabacillus halosaccharovorans]
MELHNGNLYWPETFSNISNYPKLNDVMTCDVLIVGGGMSGALCAHTLSKLPIKTVLVEKETVGSGSSAANTGLLQYENDKMLHEFIEILGKEKAVRFYELCLKAVDELELVANEITEPVDFVRRDSLYYASSEEDIPKLQKEFDALKKHQFDVDFLDKNEIKKVYSFEKPAALLTKGDAEVNPFKFIHSILKNAHQQGVEIYEQTDLEEAGSDEEFMYFQSETGKIAAKKVIYSTGYESIPFAEKLGGKINRTYAIATTPLPSFPNWMENCLIWETKRPYFYMRTTKDGRIIAGGLDENKNEVPSSNYTIEKYGELLLQKIKEHFPDYQIDVAYSWGATFGESVDGLPFIGPLPENDKVFYCLGYGGNGTVYSMIGAKMIKDLILYQSNPDAEIVRLDR